MNFLIVGGGGREHTLQWKIAQSPKVNKVYVSPGNGGTINNIDIPQDNDSLVKWAKNNNIDYVIIGPEDYLARGIVNDMTKAGIKCFGPTEKASIIESSKAYSKEFMKKYNIPTANYKIFYDSTEAIRYINSKSNMNIVIKASGLASGKGVIIPKNKENAISTIKDILDKRIFGEAGRCIVIEEKLEGDEFSLLGFSDGVTIKAMPLAQDYKKAKDGDYGLNTGGMGAIAPMGLMSGNILQNCIDGLRAEGIPFVGVIYAGLMRTPDGIRVLEFNCRFGDPETQVLLPLLKSDLVDIITSCLNKTLHLQNIEWDMDNRVIGVMLTSNGYPYKYETNKIISGLENQDSLIFHSGTNKVTSFNTTQTKLITNGGRVMCVVKKASTFREASKQVYRICNQINFCNKYYRKDIGDKYQRQTRIIVLGSTRGTDLQYIIDKINIGCLNAKICMVISDKQNAYILQRAADNNIPSKYLSKKEKSRVEYDLEMATIIDNVGDIDLILLIGYMRILSPLFVNKYTIYNVHPSLLPKYAGGMDLNVHKTVIINKEKESGCTVHLVTPELDAGKILVQKSCQIDDNETPESLKTKVQYLEGLALVEAIEDFQRHSGLDYKKSGVNLEEANNFLNEIKPLISKTYCKNVISELGGFSGIWNFDKNKYLNPVLLATTDGVGTKLKLAEIAHNYSTIGIDLVAMSINDLLASGGEPLFFLDYLATGKLKKEKSVEILKGIVEGCKQSKCSLLGGETAEMPGIYHNGDFDLAGFAVGIAEKNRILPQKDFIGPGDLLIGLSSTGLHSNGFSLVRKILNDNVFDPPPFKSNHSRLIDELLTPTKIYTEIIPLIKSGYIFAAAHITGGGLVDNIQRVLPNELDVKIEMDSWKKPEIFEWLRVEGGITQDEMFKVFNMGIGMVLIANRNQINIIDRILQGNYQIIGEICRK